MIFKTMATRFTSKLLQISALSVIIFYDEDICREETAEKSLRPSALAETHANIEQLRTKVLYMNV